MGPQRSQLFPLCWHVTRLGLGRLRVHPPRGGQLLHPIVCVYVCVCARECARMTARGPAACWKELSVLPLLTLPVILLVPSTLWTLVCPPVK